MSTVAAAAERPPHSRREAAPPPLAVAFGYFGAAQLFLLAGCAGLVWVAPALAVGGFMDPRPVAVTHLFTLGWITLSMLAALHHFVPVALHEELMPVRCAWLQLGGFVLGLTAFAAGELLRLPALVLGGAGLVGVALTGFAVRLALAMTRVRPRTRTARALFAAAAFLVTTLLLGALLAGNAAYGWLGERRPDVLALHAHVAMTGWILLVLVAVAQRLLPMFLLAHAPQPRAGALSLLLIALGALSLLLFSGAPALLRIWLPLVLVAAGVVIFLVQIALVFARHGTPELDPGMRLSGVGLVFLAISLSFAPFALRFGWTDPQRVVLYVGTAIVCAFVLFVSGHYYRILPFLVWSRRFAAAGQVPGPSRLYRQDTAVLTLCSYTLGAVLLLVGISRGDGAGARFGALLLALGAVLMVAQMLRVMRSRPAPEASRGDPARR